jgi:HDOD domain
MQLANIQSILDEDQSELESAYEESSALFTTALQANQGEFPVCSRNLNACLVSAANRDVDISDLVTQLNQDQFLSLRLVSLVNFPAYSRGAPTLNTTSAINLLGFKRLSDALKDLPSPKDYQSAFFGRAIAYDSLTQVISTTIIAQLLLRQIAPKRRLNEEVLLYSTLSSAPYLMLAYFKPQIYAALKLQAIHFSVSFDRNLKRVCKTQLHEIAIDIAKGMSLPKNFAGILTMLSIAPWNRRVWSVEEQEMRQLISAIFMANLIAEEIFRYEGGQQLRTLLKDLSSKFDLTLSTFYEILGELPTSLNASLENYGLSSTYLPVYLHEIAEKSELIGQQAEKNKSVSKNDFSMYINEIKVCMRSALAKETEFSRAPQAIYATMLCLIKCLGFTRAVYLVPNSTGSLLKVALHLGAKHKDFDTMQSSLSSKDYEHKPDIKAWLEKKTVFNGDPIFDEDWPLVAFPVIQNAKTVGIFYADKASNIKAPSLSTEEQLSVIALSEAWQDVPDWM